MTWMRLPLIHPSDLDPLQRELYDDMRAGIATGFSAFRTVMDDGAMIGPWNASVHHPAIGRASWELTKAVNAMGVLPDSAKEVAILVVGGFHKASYEIYAHVAVAERLGMPLARISSLVANLKPADLAADEAVAFDVAYLLSRGGPLPEPTWRRAVEAFGDLGAAQLVYFIALYGFVSTTLNGFDAPTPENDSRPHSSVDARSVSS
jgi:4-carboxymuconolactone decarboxylase